MKKILLISNELEGYDKLEKCILNDIIIIHYQNEILDDIINILKKHDFNKDDISIGFIYKSDLTNNMNILSEERHEKYNYFNNNIIKLFEFLNEKNSENTSTIDLITPNECNEDFIKEIKNIETELKYLKINHSLSFDKNKNIYNWILESNNENLINKYFNEKILEWEYSLLLNSYNTLQGHFGPIYDNNRSRIFHLKDINGNPINQYYDNQHRNIMYAPSKVFIEEIIESLDDEVKTKKTYIEDVVAIYPNTYAFACIKSDGSIYCWGNKEYGGGVGGSGGKKYSGWNGLSKQLTISNPQNKVIGIYSTKNAFCALLNNGTISSWGNKLNGGSNPRSIINVKEIYSNENAFCALLKDNSIYCWGNKKYGGTTPKENRNIECIYSNSQSFIALKKDGSLIGWGNKKNGGNVPKGLTNIKYVIGNYGSFTALKTNGTIISWGELGYGGSSPLGLNYVKDVYSTGYSYCGLLNDGSVKCWGHKKYGGLDIPKEENYGFIQIYSTQDSFCGLRNDGTIYCWGLVSNIPDELYGKYIKAVYSNYISFSAIYDDDKLFTWNNKGKNKKLDNVVSIDSGLYSMTAILKNGDVYNWGYDTGIKHICSKDVNNHVNTIRTVSSYNNISGLNNNIDSLIKNKEYTDKQIEGNVKGLLLNGINKFLESDYFNNNILLNSFTIEFELRIKPKFSIDNDIYILNKISENNGEIFNNDFSIIYDTKQNVLKILCEDAPQILNPSKLLVIKDNELHHYCYTFDGKSLRGFRDGKQILNKSIKNYRLKQKGKNEKIFIGTLVKESLKETQIELYNLRIWNKYLNKIEIIEQKDSELLDKKEYLLFNNILTSSNLDLDSNKFLDKGKYEINMYYHGSIIDEGLLKDIPSRNNLLLYYNVSKRKNIIKNNNSLELYGNFIEDSNSLVTNKEKYLFSSLLHDIKTINIWYKCDLNNNSTLLEIQDICKLNLDLNTINDKSNLLSNSKLYINSVLVKDVNDLFSLEILNKMGLNASMNGLVNITIVLNKKISNNIRFLKDVGNKVELGNIYIYNKELSNDEINNLFNIDYELYNKVIFNNELLDLLKKKEELEKYIEDDNSSVGSIKSDETKETNNKKDVGTVIEVDSVSILGDRATYLETIVEDEKDIGNLDDIPEEDDNESIVSLKNNIERVSLDCNIKVENIKLIVSENKVKNLVIISPNIEIKDYINDKTKYIQKENIEIDDIIKELDEDIENIGFVYHSNSSNIMPYFQDKDNNEKTYNFFSNKFIELLIDIKNIVEKVNIDLIACNLNHPKMKKEVIDIEKLLNINIRYSIDETGNEGDWILESDNIDIRDLYFNNEIENWNILLEKEETIDEDIKLITKENINLENILELKKIKINNGDKINNIKLPKEIVRHNYLNVMFKLNKVKEFKVEGKDLILNNRIKKKNVNIIKSCQKINIQDKVNKNEGLYVNLYNINDYVVLNNGDKSYTINKIEDEKYEILETNEIFSKGEIINKDGYKIEFGGVSVDNQTSSGSSGDPYIKTLKGEIYKMKDKPGIYRMFEGENLIINAETSWISENHKYKIESYANNLVNNIIKTGTYFSKLYINNEGDELLLNLENGKCYSNNKGSILFGKQLITNSNFELYKNIKCKKIPLLIKNKYHKYCILELEKFNIPQIENGFTLKLQKENINEIGLIVDSYKEKDMRIKKINNLKSKKNKNYKTEIKGPIMKKNELWISIKNK